MVADTRGMQTDTKGKGGIGRYERHKRFQNRIGALFLASAALVGVWIMVGPDPPEKIIALSVLLFVELPLFVILALIGLNALVRGAKGPRK